MKLAKSLLAAGLCLVQSKNVVYLMIDDFGWGDFGIHGSKLETPNLDAIARDGILLDKYYTQQVCSPTRSSLLTGRYPIRYGMQHNVILAGQTTGIPKEYSLLPQDLKSCGFSTHMVGKWHCGHSHEYMLPFNRGFDSYYGYLQGAEDHYSRIQCQAKEWCGVDFCTEKGPTNSTWGTYGTEIYSSQVARVLDDVAKDEKPFFLYYAMQNVHDPLQAPEHYKIKFDWIKEPDRRTYAAMVSIMDDAVGDFMTMLHERNLYDDTLIIITADNGGETRSGGNNFPLRSQKWSLYEGGVHVNAMLSGGLIKDQSKSTFDGLVHVSDWRETILEAMECKPPADKSELDGMSQWQAILRNTSPPRQSIVHNIDPIKTVKGTDERQWVQKLAAQSSFNINSQSAIRYGRWKLLTGDPALGVPDGNIPPPEGNQKKLRFAAEPSDTRPVWQKLIDDSMYESSETLTRLVQLYDIEEDPYEKHEISDNHPDIVKVGLDLLSRHNETAVWPNYPHTDPNSNPETRSDGFAGFWWPWV